jgi:hypothetical protein
MRVAAGPDLVRKIMLAYQADVPILLHGPHGIGKSELAAEAAQTLGIAALARDLSLMEPTDLVGMPVVDHDRTRFRQPAWLPKDGRGLLILEELNRCPRYMQAPALQLLSARQLNDYVLPSGWLPMAAVNDAEDGYHVDACDPALLSRFVRFRVEPDRDTWCAWARARDVHPTIIEFVGMTPDIFDVPTSNPRSWTYAARLLTTWECDPDRTDHDLVVLLAGVLDETWAHAFLKVYRERPRPPTARELAADYRSWRRKIRAWVSAGQLDIPTAAWTSLRQALEDPTFAEAVRCDLGGRANVDAFVADLPGDLRMQARRWLMSHGFTEDGERCRQRGSGTRQRRG